MDDQLFEELAKRWPDLMKKSRQDYLGVGDGWYTILDVLCGMLSSKVERARYEHNFALENPTNRYIKPIDELELAIEQAIEDLPTIAQIKEKFGGLRFYVSSTSDENHAIISFAEQMASRTCEVCGAPGTIRGGNWMKTLCDTHHAQREAKEPMFKDLIETQ